jgi:transposase
VTVLTDRNSGTIIEILDDRKKAMLKEWLEENQDRLHAVRSVSMEMWEPYINTLRETIEGADQKICFDRFHIAACFAKALDKIRATEHRQLGGLGLCPLTRTKHDWLRTKAKNEYKDKRSFLSLTRLNLKTARAWRIKETANGLWSYSYRGVAERHWKSLLGWISRSRLEPMIKVVRIVKTHLWGNPECDPAEGDQRHRGIGQCNDSEDQSESLWVSKSGKIPDGNSLPQGRVFLIASGGL